MPEPSWLTSLCGFIFSTTVSGCQQLGRGTGEGVGEVEEGAENFEEGYEEGRGE